MQRLSRLLVPLMLSVLVFALLRTGVQAYAVMTNVWPQGSTTYVTEQSMMDEFGWNGVYRTDEAAEHWHDETVFSFSYHAGEENWIKAYQFSSGQDRYGFMIPTEDAYGIYRDSYEIHINTAPRDEDNNVIPWYAGVGGVPGNAGDLRTVLRHEFGHAAGLHHAETGGTNQLMYKSIARGTSKGIANDERNGMRYLYEANYNATHPDNTDYWLRAYPATWDDNFFNTYVGFKGRNWIGGSPFPRASLTTMAWSDGDGTSGATSWLAFTGERITWRFAKVSNRGTNRIYIDGNYVETIDTSDPTDILWQVERTWDLSNGDHLIEVRGDGPSNGMNKFTDLDAFIVNVARHTGTVDDSSSNIRFIGDNTWTHASGWVDAWDDTVSWSDTPDDAVAFTFNGTGVTYYFTRANNRGRAKVTIDGVDTHIVDLYSASPVWQSSVTFDNLPNGTHQIHIAVTGDRNPSSGGDFVDIDKFEVIP